MDVNERVLDAIELLTANSVKKAGYDKTIQAQVLSCEDATIGKYRCRYQDAIIYAYASSSQITFTEGSYVYVLVPNGDMGKEKTILGTTKKLGINYISQAEGDEAYDFIGNNCCETDNNIFYLDTNNKNYRYALYLYNREDNDVRLDSQSLDQYIKQSSSLIVGGIFKTTIKPQKQYQGHYGIIYNLRFLDNTSNKQVVRSYIIDEDNMINNPYRLSYETRQYQIFDIDGVNFIRVESIEIFNNSFPGAEGEITGEKLLNGDIEISNLELNGAVRMSESEVNGVAISFYTPQGTFFTDSSSSANTNYKTITAQVRVKGKLVSNAQNIPFYWGKENVGITSRSENYNKYLGRGWRCLNQKNIIKEKTDTSDPIVQWVPATDTYILNFEAATARENKFKVAIVYDGNVITKEINIQNLSLSTPELTIESSGGTQFYYDIGHPTLTCKVNGAELNNYKYYWAYQDNTGFLTELPETLQLNIDYNDAVTDLNTLKTEIANGTKFANAQKDVLEEMEQRVKSFDFIQRVQGNKIYDVQINNITSFGTFKCSVYSNEDIYLGTTSITLTNKLEGQDLYSLVINNGAVTFQYNENGVAPNNKSLDVQQQIQGLSFTIYDNLGQPIDSDIVANSNNCKIRWQFPIKETMLEDLNDKKTSSGTDATQTYQYYDNRVNLVYGILQNYDIKRQRNQIKLTVNYKGMNLTTQTSFTFVKQGEPGTNGTEYIVKLVPNTIMDNPPLYPMVTKKGNRYYINYGLNSPTDETEIGTVGHQLFKVQLWHSGNLIWQGFKKNNNDNNPSLISVRWEILKNKYNNRIQDESAFDINSNDGNINCKGFTSNQNNKSLVHIQDPLANIIKCSITWQGKTYYGTIPIITAQVANNYRVKLKDYTGFRYVIYTSDGVTPQYDSSHPFEFICEEYIKNYETNKWKWEDISLIPGNYSLYYRVKGIGNYKYVINKSTEIAEKIDSNLLTVIKHKDELKENQWQVRPSSRYDGVSVNNAIYCLIGKGKDEDEDFIGRINIPIHFLLNKYGLSHINDWDGNSIQINNDGGYILSPQMGAGVKNGNQFTGVLMGQVRNPGKQEPDIGLLGFSDGERTIFLNSKNGSALFGKTGAAQIIIDPKAAHGMLYSGNFWKESAYDTKTGLPIDYKYKKDNSYEPLDNGYNAKAGLLIDLTTPEIYFGNGNFYVTKDGYMHAAGGGDIAGWKLGIDKLTSRSGKITLYAGKENDPKEAGSIYSNSHSTLTSTSEGFYLSQDGLSFGSKTKITNTGQMYLGAGAVTGNGKYWTIDGDSKKAYIAYGGKLSYTSANNTETDIDKDPSMVYLGTDGISLGRRFSVRADGSFMAFKGKIGGWDIGLDTLQAKNIILDSNGNIATANFNQNAETGWKITSNGNAIFNNLIANKTGKIGGWTINQNTLTSNDGKLILYASGSIQGDGWILNANTLQAHNTNGTLKIDLVGGGTLVSGAGSVGSSGGYFGSSNQGGAGITYDKSNVTIKGKTVKIESGVSIGDYFTVNRSGLQGNSRNGSIYLDASTGMVNASIIRGASFQASQGDNDYKSGRTGVITFSDGATITVTCGLITHVTKGKGSGSTTWSGN